MYVLQLAREDKTVDADIGIIIHRFLSEYHSGNVEAAMTQLAIDTISIDADSASLVNGVIAYYCANSDKIFPAPTKPGPGVIIEEEKDLYSKAFDHKGFRLKGKADLVITEGNTITIWEHKTPNRPKSDVFKNMNRQADLYHLMVSEMNPGKDVVVVLNLIQKAFPRRPEITKQGKVSRAKITTTVDMYRQAIIDNGENPEDYADVLMSLPDSIYIVRHPIYGLDRRETIFATNQIIDDMMPWLHKMPRRDESFLCDNCGYSDICVAGKDNYDRVMQYINTTEWQSLYKRR